MTASSRKETIGIIGLGLMGQMFARRLLAAGYQITGYDVVPAQGELLAAEGGLVAASGQDVAAHASRIILSLPDHTVTRSVLEEMRDCLGAAHLIIDTTTGSPAEAVEQSLQLARRDVRYLDATVSGSSAQVASGEAVLMVGGTDDAFASAENLLACLGDHVIHTGSAGTGAKMKLVTNLVLGINRAALAEGLALAQSLGLEGERTLSVLRSSMAYSRIMDTKGEKMLRGDFAPQARLAQHLKDVRLMLAATPLNLPLTEAHRGLLERAVERGYGALDNSAIIKAYDA